MEIIEVPEYGNLSAQFLYKKLKIQSSNDQEKLKQAKEDLYLKSFNSGVLLVGEFKNQKVTTVKNTIRD